MATAITTTELKAKEISPKKTEKLLAEAFTIKARMKNVEVGDGKGNEPKIGTIIAFSSTRII